MITKDQIYRRRAAFTKSLVSDITDYRQKLLEATAPGAEVADSIRSHASQTDLCVARQLQILDEWIIAEHLETDGSSLGHLWASEARSPINFFAFSSADLHLRRLRKDGRQGECGLVRLAAMIENDGKTRLLQWMAETGKGAQMATAKHIAYMAEQKRKLSR